jgi:hypothetical protein
MIETASLCWKKTIKLRGVLKGEDTLAQGS